MLTLALAVMAAGVTHAEGFKEGTDYETLSLAGEKNRGDSVEIIEFFSYGCGHCASLEPHLTAWIEEGQPDGTRLVRVPVAWSQGFEALARVYYTADILGVPEDAHQGIFDLIHVDRAQLSLPMIAEARKSPSAFRRRRPWHGNTGFPASRHSSWTAPTRCPAHTTGSRGCSRR
jgi:thiol-disulfide isomerase/thioredoxin